MEERVPNRGAMLVFGSLVVSMIILLVLASMQRSMTELSIARRAVDQYQTFHLAEAGLDEKLQDKKWTKNIPDLVDCNLPNDPFDPSKDSICRKALGTTGEYVVKVTTLGSNRYKVEARGYAPAATTSFSLVTATVQAKPLFTGLFGFDWIQMKLGSKVWGDIGTNSIMVSANPPCLDPPANPHAYPFELCDNTSTGVQVKKIDATKGGYAWLTCDVSQPQCQSKVFLGLNSNSCIEGNGGCNQGVLDTTDLKQLSAPESQVDQPIPQELLDAPMLKCTAVGATAPPPLCGASCGLANYTTIPCVAGNGSNQGLDLYGNLLVNSSSAIDGKVKLPAKKDVYRFNSIKVGSGAEIRFGNPTGSNSADSANDTMTRIWAQQLWVSGSQRMLSRGPMEIYLSGPGTWVTETFTLGTGAEMWAIQDSGTGTCWTKADCGVDPSRLQNGVKVYVHNDDPDSSGPDMAGDAGAVFLKSSSKFYGSLHAPHSTVEFGQGSSDSETADCVEAGFILGKTVLLNANVKLKFLDGHTSTGGGQDGTVLSWQAD